MKNLAVVINYLKSDIVKKQRSFKLGFITIFLVVLFVSILMNFIYISPIIFLKLSENQIGEGDIMMTPLLNNFDVSSKKSRVKYLINNKEIEYNSLSNYSTSNNSEISDNKTTSNSFLDNLLNSIDGVNITQNLDRTYDSSESLNFNFQLLNFTNIEENIINGNFSTKYDVSGLAPRWIFFGNSSYQNMWALSAILILNSKMENYYEFGRKNNLNNLGYQECYISESLQKSLKLDLTKDSFIDISANALGLFNTLRQEDTKNADKVNYISSEINSELDSIDPYVEYDLYTLNRRVVFNPYPTHKVPININKTKIKLTYDNSSINDENSYILNERIEEGKNLLLFLEQFQVLNEDINISINADVLVNQLLNINQVNSFFNNTINLSIIRSFIQSSNVERIIDESLDSIFPEIMNPIAGVTNNRTLNLNFSGLVFNITTNNIIDNSTNEIQNTRTSLRNGILSLVNLINNGVTINSNIFKDESNENNTISINSTRLKLDRDEIVNVLKNTELSYKLNILSILKEIDILKLLELFSFKLRLKVNSIVPGGSQGKWPSSLGNVIAFDSNYGKNYLLDNAVRFAVESIEILFGIVVDETQINQIRQRLIDDFFFNFDMNHYSLIVNAALKNKFDLYKQSSKSIQLSLTDTSNTMIRRMNVTFPTKMQLTVFNTYQGLSIVKIFLDNIFSSIMFFLVILSITLIYSLMLGNVEERTYEFGMIRALGYKKNNLILLIIIQAFLFSIPGISIGLVVAGILNTITSYFLFNFTGISADYSLNYSTVLVVSLFFYLGNLLRNYNSFNK